MNNSDSSYPDTTDLHKYTPDNPLKSFIGDYLHVSLPAKNLCDNYLHPLPDGTVEIYLCLGESRVALKQGESEKYYQHFLFRNFNFYHQPLIKPVTSDPYFSNLIIQLKFSTYKHLFHIPLSKLKEPFIELENLWDQQAKRLKEFFYGEKDVQVIIKYLNNFFNKLIQVQMVDKNYRRLDQIHDFCKKKRGLLSVEEIARHTQLSYRTIHRLFTDEIGICPKEYLKILRFNKVCNCLNGSRNVNWSELIYSCGYYDQAHFIHDFKNIMKSTPNNFIKHNHGQFFLMRPNYFHQ
ncbi:MAG: AraC family transcriptional regulator [Bacteroidales bacterium]|jgi:AraC-like DNA-binding protein|nr:AraC family transcriptional regulator [Bacteroidales bacterium]